MVEKKLNENDKNSAPKKPLADLKNEEVNEQINQDPKIEEPSSEVTKKPNKFFKFKKSSSPEINNSNLEVAPIKLAPLEKEESLPSLDKPIQKNLEEKGSTIKKFKFKKSTNSTVPTKDDKQEELQNT